MTEVNLMGAGVFVMQETSRRVRKKEETRKKILDAASKLFLENGFLSTTVDEITGLADVGKGTFYNYFATKEAVLCELMDNISRNRANVIWPAVMECDDTRKRLIKSFESICSWVEKYPELIKSYMGEQIKVNTERKSSHMEIYFAEILKMGQEAGDIRNDLDINQMVMYLDGIFLMELLQWYESGAKSRLIEKVMQSVDFFLIGALSTDL